MASKIQQGLDWLNQEIRRDEKLIKIHKEKTIKEILQLDKKIETNKLPTEKKLALLSSLY